MQNISSNALLRLPQVLALIPVSRSAWWAGPGLGLDLMHASGTHAGVTDEEPGEKRGSFFLHFGGKLFQKRGNIRCPPRRCARAEFDGFRIPTALAARPRNFIFFLYL